MAKRKTPTAPKPATAETDVIVQGRVVDTGESGLENIDENPRRQFTGYDEIQMYAGLLDLGLDGFIAAIDEDAPVPVPEEKVYGLLALERNGQNRTEYVKAAIARLGLTKDDPLPGGGPGYTNDVHPVSDLYS
jgi:hypothetical protein